MDGKTEDEIEMMKMMGFASFDTTKVRAQCCFVLYRHKEVQWVYKRSLFPPAANVFSFISVSHSLFHHHVVNYPTTFFLIAFRQLKFVQLAAFHNVVVTHCKYGDGLLPEVTLKLCFCCCVVFIY